MAQRDALKDFLRSQCEVLRQQVKDHDDWTLEQHAEALAKATGITLKKSAIDKYFRRLGITRRKRAFVQQNATKRRESSGEHE